MKINVESIPHSTHRYSTCGDWWFDADGTLQIRVSQEMPVESQELVVLHELAEVIMCKANGVTQKQVDDFDMGFEKNRKPGDDSEPGDHKDAPYHDQHKLATIIEVIASVQMHKSWTEHEEAIGKLFED